MTDAWVFDPQASTAASMHLEFGLTTATAVQPETVERASHLGPLSIPESQRYYWTRRWQDDELESRRQHAVGETECFTDVAAAIAWLDSDDDA